MRIQDLGHNEWLVKAVAESRGGDVITHERVIHAELEWWNPWALIHAAIQSFEGPFVTGDFSG